MRGRYPSPNQSHSKLRMERICKAPSECSLVTNNFINWAECLKSWTLILITVFSRTVQYQVIDYIGSTTKVERGDTSTTSLANFCGWPSCISSGWRHANLEAEGGSIQSEIHNHSTNSLASERGGCMVKQFIQANSLPFKATQLDDIHMDYSLSRTTTYMDSGIKVI